MAVVEWNAWALVYLVILVLAAGLLVGVLVNAARRPRPEGSHVPAGETSSPAADGGDVEDPEGHDLAEILSGHGDPEPYMAQFVHDEDGERVGETIGVHEDRVIVKSGEMFYAVLQRQVRYENGALVADEDVDWDAAKEQGEAWREARHQELQYDEHGNPVRDEA